MLVPGAKAVAGSWQRLEANPVLSAMFGALRDAMGKMLGTNAPQPGSQEMPLVTAEQCRAEMSEAFADVEVHDIAHEQRYARAAEIWHGIERTMAPIVLMRKGFGEERATP